jgi:hypothetical protein
MKITITETNGQLDFQPEGDINFEDGITMLLTAVLGQANSLFAAAEQYGMDAEGIQCLKEGVYDRFNYAFARILDEILPPSQEFTENLTAEAIVRAENELIQEAYDQLSEEDKATPVEFPKAPVEMVEEEDA